jgi:YebC/PmpR family DNA-binding regulatory protein
MAGHNKWKQIKEKKNKNDAKKGLLFGKLAQLIMVEAKKAKGDQNAPGLRSVLEKAREVNMPNENIERAIKKALGKNDLSLEKVIYECYGPGGVAIVIETITDNKNRTAQEIKHLLSKEGYSLAAPGSALWAFKKIGEELKPETLVKLTDENLEKLSALVMLLENHDDVRTVITNAE